MNAMVKTSTREHNVANWVAVHVARRFPELAANPIPGVWFTGSNVWSMIYDIGPSAECRDWDIFTEDEITAVRLVTGMSWNLLPAFPTKYKRTNDRDPKVDSYRHIPSLARNVGPDKQSYSNGYCYLTDRGEVDVWVTTEGHAVCELRTYPIESHAHCRAAFSFTDGLLVLPNECATYGAWKTQNP